MPEISTKISEKIKEKYSVQNNTFSIKAKDDPRDLVLVEIGDAKTPNDFLPQYKIQRWGNECNFSARLVHGEKNPKITTKDNKILWKGKSVEAEFYNIDPCEEHPEGAYEFNVVLNEKPETNRIEFTLQTKGLDFFYQPALTEEEIAEGTIRPENVVGSYAVYASENKVNWIGSKEYKSGKVGHIYRPKIFGDDGAWVWGDLEIDTVNGLLTIIIPQIFLVRAKFPVVVDPTFGYTTAGATQYNPSNTGFPYTSKYASAASLTESGTVTSIVASCAYRYIPSNAYAACAIYDSTPSVRLGVSALQLVTNVSKAWVSFNLSSSVALSIGTYYLAFKTCRSTYDHYLWGDTSGGSSCRQADSGTSAPSNPFGTVYSTGSQRYSIYAVYTATGGTAWTKNLSDTATTTSSVGKSIGSVRSDTAGSFDSLGTTDKEYAALSDIAISTDVITKKATVKANAETATVSDGRSSSSVKANADTGSVVDSAYCTVGIVQSDSCTIIDEMRFATSGSKTLSLNDSITTSDSLASTSNYVLPIDDSVVGEDSIITTPINLTRTYIIYTTTEPGYPDGVYFLVVNGTKYQSYT